ncbi:MAG: glycosyltransferase family 39 protein [bacterium]
MIVGNVYYPRDYEYGEIARNIVAGKGFSRVVITGENPVFTSSHAPLYPYFLAFFYQWKTKSVAYLVIYLIQALFSILTIYFIYKTARLIFNESVARKAELFIAIYPPLIYYVTKIVPTTIFLFLLALTTFLFINSSGKNFLYYLLCGIVQGILILCDPVALVLFPVLLIWFFFDKRINFFQTCLVIFISVIVLLPWTIRNYRVHRAFVPVTTQFGINFWIGNNPNATGTDFYKIKSIQTDEYILMTQTLPADLQDSLNKISEIERARFYLLSGTNFILHNPLKFLSLLIKKFFYYWWFAPSSEYASKDLQKYRVLMYIFYTPVLILGLAGLFCSIKNHKEILFIVLSMVFISGLYIFTHVGLIRYRMPVEQFLMMFMAYFISLSKNETT